MTDALIAAGQAHLVAHAQTLGPADRDAFLARAAAQPWDELRSVHAATPAGSQPALRPPAGLMWKRQLGVAGIRKRLADMGHRLIQAGRVGTLLLAGGEGSRLGFDGPKGNVVFGPDDDRTLYRILMERVLRASRTARRPLPVYILVSDRTQAATREAFDAAGYFGLARDQVRFLKQGLLPVLDAQGQALLAAPGQLAMAPDGHGGTHDVLRRSGALDELAAEGIDVLTTFQVDNPLGRPLDPVMLGWMLERKAQIVTKVVRKADPGERVGVLARDLEGHTHLVEYSELPEEGAADLLLGSIAIHAFSVPWLRDLLGTGYLPPLHRAHKKVPYLDADGLLVQPDAPNAYKFERFLFDVFPQAPRVEVHEVPREWEFAPVKNATGVDSLTSSRQMVEAEVLRWHNARELPIQLPLALHPLELDGAELFDV